MKRIGPALSYFGAKWRSAPMYPAPKHEVIIEPFAGGAGYSLLHHERDVILIEKYSVVAGIWRYLINADPQEILCLPDIENGQSVSELEVCDEAKSLIGFWINKACERPRKTPSAWMRSHPSQFWGDRVRRRVAEVSSKISHWKIIEGEYFDAPAIEATWFVDPPYQVQGKRYPCGSSDIDYTHLAKWCQDRPGQVIVCENEGADWLPFRHFANTRSNQANSGRLTSPESIWTNE